MRESFVSENDVLRLYLSTKNMFFVLFVVRYFGSKEFVFLFLNSVKWFKQEIYAYGDLLQNERHVLKHVSNSQNEKKKIENFPCLENKKQNNLFKSCFFLMFKNQKHVFEAFLSLQHEKHTFLKRFSSLKYKNHVFETFFKFTKWKHTFLKRFHTDKIKNMLFPGKSFSHV